MMWGVSIDLIVLVLIAVGTLVAILFFLFGGRKNGNN